MGIRLTFFLIINFAINIYTYKYVSCHKQKIVSSDKQNISKLIAKFLSVHIKICRKLYKLYLWQNVDYVAKLFI